MFALSDPSSPRPNQRRTIQFESRQRRTSDIRSCKHRQTAARPAKVSLPFVLSWIEERHDQTGSWIGRAMTSLFERIAPKAAPSEIVGRIAATIRLRDDVIHREVVTRAMFARSAVLAPIVRAAGDEDSDRERNPAHRNCSSA